MALNFSAYTENAFLALHSRGTAIAAARTCTSQGVIVGLPGQTSATRSPHSKNAPLRILRKLWRHRLDIVFSAY